MHGWRRLESKEETTSDDPHVEDNIDIDIVESNDAIVNNNNDYDNDGIQKYTIRPSVLSALTALAITVTSCTSIALTYMLQTQWRTLKRLPFISSAHYDDRQSPVFAAMTAVSAICALSTVLSTYVVSMKRYARNHAHETWTWTWSSSSWSSSSWRRLTNVGLMAGCACSVLSVLTGAVSSKMVWHLPFVIALALTTLVWTCLVNATLPPDMTTTHDETDSDSNRDCNRNIDHGHDHNHDHDISGNVVFKQRQQQKQQQQQQRGYIVASWVCSAMLCSSVFAALGIRDKTTSAIVLVEYVNTLFTVVYFVLLALRLRGSCVTVG